MIRNLNRPTRVYESLVRMTYIRHSSGSTTAEEVVVSTEICSKKPRRQRFRRVEDVPSLKDFVHRKTVLNLYRTFLRTVRPMPDRQELSSQIRKEFASSQHVKDAWDKKRALQEGNRRLKDLQALVSTAAVLPSDNIVVAQVEDTNENDNDGDQRVGKGWPWERKN